VNSSLIPNQIQTVAPNSSVRGPVNIVSSFPNGWTSLAPMAFSYGPHIQYVVPSGDRPSGGSQITILGYGFGSDTSHISVKIGGQAAEVLNSQPFALLHFPIYTLTVKAPQGGAGSAADLVVSTSTGDFTLPGVFHYWQDVQDFPIAGNFTEILHDSNRNQLYLLDPTARHIQVFSLNTQQFLVPIATGASPRSMVLTPDGSRLAIANVDDNTVWLIDPSNSQNRTVVNVALPNNTAGYQPTILAPTSTGKLFVHYLANNTTGGVLQTLDLRSLALTLRADNPCGGCIIESTADGTKVFFAENGASSGFVSIYDSGTDTFTFTRELQSYLTEFAPGPDGNRWVRNFNLLDATNAIESVTSIPDLIALNSPNAVFGQRVQSGGGLLYLPLVNGLHIYDLPHGRLLRMYGGLSLSTTALHTISLDDSGQYIYAISPTGLQIATLDSVPLSIGHISPTSAAAGGGTTLTVRGSGFTSATQVVVGGATVAAQFVDSNTLRFISPPLPPGNVRVTVKDSSGNQVDLDTALTSN